MIVWISFFIVILIILTLDLGVLKKLTLSAQKKPQSGSFG
jgi:hypothetical protein